MILFVYFIALVLYINNIGPNLQFAQMTEV